MDRRSQSSVAVPAVQTRALVNSFGAQQCGRRSRTYREHRSICATLLRFSMIAPLMLQSLVPGFVLPGNRPLPAVMRITAPPHLGFFDDVKERLREVTVQHILVTEEVDALEIYDSILSEGATASVVGRFAASRSTCGSAKKTPEAKLQLLRGQPGELTFRRGAMAAEFEQAAFAATPGSLLPPVRTQFGWHIIFVSNDSPPPPNGGERGSTSQMVMCSTDEPSTVAAVESIASRATEAMREGRALVQPLFLSGEVLDAARSDMQSVFEQAPTTGDAFESIQTCVSWILTRPAPAPQPHIDRQG